MMSYTLPHHSFLLQNLHQNLNHHDHQHRAPLAGGAGDAPSHSYSDSRLKTHIPTLCHSSNFSSSSCSSSTRPNFPAHDQFDNSKPITSTSFSSSSSSSSSPLTVKRLKTTPDNGYVKSTQSFSPTHPLPLAAAVDQLQLHKHQLLQRDAELHDGEGVDDYDHDVDEQRSAASPSSAASSTSSSLASMTTSLSAATSKRVRGKPAKSLRHQQSATSHLKNIPNFRSTHTITKFTEQADVGHKIGNEFGEESDAFELSYFDEDDDHVASSPHHISSSSSVSSSASATAIAIAESVLIASSSSSVCSSSTSSVNRNRSASELECNEAIDGDDEFDKTCNDAARPSLHSRSTHNFMSMSPTSQVSLPSVLSNNNNVSNNEEHDQLRSSSASSSSNLPTSATSASSSPSSKVAQSQQLQQQTQPQPSQVVEATPSNVTAPSSSPSPSPPPPLKLHDEMVNLFSIVDRSMFALSHSATAAVTSTGNVSLINSTPSVICSSLSMLLCNSMPDDVDMMEQMFESEKKYQANANYFHSHHATLDASMRPVLIDWICEVCQEYCLGRESFHLTVNYIDRYLSLVNSTASSSSSNIQITRSNLQLLGVACLSIAAKLEEIYSPTPVDFASTTDDAFTPAQIVGMEKHVLGSLKWSLHAPTAVNWLKLYIKLVIHRLCQDYLLLLHHHTTSSAASSSAVVQQLSTDFQHTLSSLLSTQLFERAMLFIDLTTLDLSFLRFYPSAIAAAAFILVYTRVHPVFPSLTASSATSSFFSVLTYLEEITSYTQQVLTSTIHLLTPFYDFATSFCTIPANTNTTHPHSSSSSSASTPSMFVPRKFHSLSQYEELKIPISEIFMRQIHYTHSLTFMQSLMQRQQLQQLHLLHLQQHQQQQQQHDRE